VQRWHRLHCEAHRPSPGPQRPRRFQVQADLGKLREEGVDERRWPAEATDVGAEHTQKWLPSARPVYARAVAGHPAHTLLNLYISDSKEGPQRNQARLRKCACSPASAWLQALPLCGEISSTTTILSAQRALG
jgi:hypothetical protein